MIIVYRGTEINDKNDIENDKQMLRNKLPDQTKNALEIYDRMSKIYANALLMFYNYLITVIKF